VLALAAVTPAMPKRLGYHDVPNFSVFASTRAGSMPTLLILKLGG
jgi:hypothetical protein